MGYTLTEVGCEETFTKDNHQITRTFHVNPWASRREFLAVIMGGVDLVAGRLVRVFPARDPDYPFFFAKSCSFTPLDDDPGLHAPSADVLATRAIYQTAVAKVAYAPLVIDVPNAPQQNEQQEMDLANVAWDFSARNLTLPNQWFVWKGTPTDTGNNGVLANTQTGVTRTFPSFSLVVTRHLLARKPTNAILGNLGRINKSPITLAGDTYPAESLRFDSAKATRRMTTKGLYYFELSYTFACQPIYDTTLGVALVENKYVGWNRLFNPKEGKWQYVVANTSPARTIYDLDENGPTQSGISAKGFRLLFHPSAS